MRIQTLCEQGWGYRRITAAYPLKQWRLDTVKAICKRYRENGSAVNRKVGSGRQISARCQENIEAVRELICSQESQPGTSKSTREISQQIGISQGSVRNIAKKDFAAQLFQTHTSSNPYRRDETEETCESQSTD